MAKGRILASGAVNDVTGIFAAAPGVAMNDKHYLIMDGYESVLHDYMKRDFTIGLICNDVESEGPVHTWNEQTKIPSNAKAADPKMGFATSGNPNYHDDAARDEDYGRDNWQNCVPRFYASRIQYDFFAKQCALKYSAFGDLMSKDWNDLLVDYTRVKSEHFWNGKSASISDTVSANKFEYTGILKQIGALPANNKVIAPTTLIVDAIQTALADMQMRMDYTGFPTVIAMNASTFDLMVREELARNGANLNLTTEIMPGWSIPCINTYIGKLGIILTPYIRPVVGATDVTHTIALLNPSQIDRIWWFDKNPQILEFANSDVPNANARLLTDKGVMSFDNYVVRGVQTGSNFLMTKVVPK